QMDNMGAVVLRRLFKTLRPWMNNSGHTNEGSGFAPKPFSLTLDYILVSENLDVLEAGVIRPDSKAIYLGCDSEVPGRIQKNLRRGRVIVDYFDKKQKKKCFATVEQEYFDAKMASDHYPIYARVKFK